MSWFEALILGIIQGLTEFLPVSSSGHIELGKALLGVDLDNDLFFTLLVHVATVLSTILVFRKTILELIQGLLKFEWNESTKYLSYIVLSMVPVGIVGVFFEDQVSVFFTGNLILVGSMLLLTGGLLFFTHFKASGDHVIGTKNAFLIGLAQAVAVLPGISRSGATIATALLLKVNKDEAAKFSFLMVLPPILGAALLKFLEFRDLGGISSIDSELPVMFIGFLAAFVSGILACTAMIRIVRQQKLIYFGIYCLLVGLVAIIFA